MAKTDLQTEGEANLEALPSWKRQSVERSLKTARVRAADRSDRFVKAGIDLIKTTGDTGFTVQEVVDGSGMSIRTFYMFFASKDDLLLAIHETLLSTEVEPRLRRRCDAVADPVGKIDAFITALFKLTGNSEPATRALIVQQHRLAELRADALDVALEPQISLFIELVRNAANAGLLRDDLEVETTARLLHHMLLSVVEGRVLGSSQSAAIPPEQVVHLCRMALGAASSTA
jgi:AcrR family transcriptional regulator